MSLGSSKHDLFSQQRVCRNSWVGGKNVLVLEAPILLLSTGTQDSSGVIFLTYGRFSEFCLKYKKMHFSMPNPLVQVSGSISSICLRNSQITA